MKKLIMIAMLLASSVALADCPHLYPNNTPLVIPGAVELCNEQYVSLYDPRNRAVLLTSELIQPTEHVVVRKNSFHRDKRVSQSVTPAEYDHSGWDKGHMAPADDAATDSQMYESFAMTNMTPQNPELNRGRWRGLEGRVRTHAERSPAPTHVVTVAIYSKQLQMMGNVPIPESYGKVAYFVTGTAAFHTKNTSDDTIHIVDLDWLNKQIPFIQLPR